MTAVDHDVFVVGRRAFYPVIAAFAASCLVATLATDIAYFRTADVFWLDVSDWLVSVGFVAGVVALVVGLIEHFAIRTPVFDAPGIAYTLALIAALVLGLFDMMVHTRDAWIAVAPWGLALSAAITLVLLLAGFIRRLAPAPLARMEMRSEEIVR